jgi:FkbM family methyltransferase
MTAEVNGFKYNITNHNDLIQRYLVQKQQWNGEVVTLLEALINSRLLTHFVNVGAHIGTVCIPTARLVDKVTAIEAYPPTFHELQENIKLNGITNIDCHNIAVGNSEDTVYFMNDALDRVKNNMGGMHVFTEADIAANRRSSNTSDKRVSCKMTRFDDLAIGEFDIMLVDIEGMEYDFLQGARASLLKNKPVLIIEIWDDEKRKSENMDTTRKQMIDYITAMGYTLFTTCGGDDFVFFPV